MRERLTPMSGEFVSREREAAFRLAHADETLRHTRLIFALTAVLNALFLISDWRFAGTPHFFVAIPARLVVIAMSLVCLLAVMRTRSVARAETALVAWQIVVAVSVGFLVSSRSDIAQLVVMMLPTLFYLVIPTSFRLNVGCAVFTSVAMLVGFFAPAPGSPTILGMVLAMAMLNGGLGLVLSRANRRRRLEWAATEAERRANDELAESRRNMRRLFMAVPVPLVVTHAETGAILEANDAAYAYFGAGRESLGLETILDIYVDPSERSAFLEALRENGQVRNFETRIRLADGSIRHVLLAADRQTFEGKPCVITGAVDISRHKEVEAHLDRLATTDALTGLPNRSRFMELATTELERAVRYRRPLTVMMLDLDHFKRLNDTHGHAAGDAALGAFAALCQRTLRRHDVIARLGGEEFAAILPETSALNALTLAERLRSETERLVVPGAPDGLHLTVSIGIANVHEGEPSIEAALARADRALYAAKRAGRNRVRSEEATPVLAVGT
jgi:diguanylate cyclase (GGDEF)-like protein/PAS domain S-box-containing protein